MREIVDKHFPDNWVCVVNIHVHTCNIIVMSEYRRAGFFRMDFKLKSVQKLNPNEIVALYYNVCTRTILYEN